MLRLVGFLLISGVVLISAMSPIAEFRQDRGAGFVLFTLFAFGFFPGVLGLGALYVADWTVRRHSRSTYPPSLTQRKRSGWCEVGGRLLSGAVLLGVWGIYAASDATERWILLAGLTTILLCVYEIRVQRMWTSNPTRLGRQIMGFLDVTVFLFLRLVVEVICIVLTRGRSAGFTFRGGSSGGAGASRKW